MYNKLNNFVCFKLINLVYLIQVSAEDETAEAAATTTTTTTAKKKAPTGREGIRHTNTASQDLGFTALLDPNIPDEFVNVWNEQTTNNKYIGFKVEYNIASLRAFIHRCMHVPLKLK